MTLLTALMVQLILAVGGLKQYNHNITIHPYPLYCRTERSLGAYLSFARYHDDTCSRCYHYMPRWAFVNNTKHFRYLGIIGQLHDPVAKVLFHPQLWNRSNPIFATFKSSRYANLWLSCCKAAVECCHTMLSTPEWQSDAPYCPRTWDGWQCWPDTPAGKITYIRCPDHIYFKNEPPQCPRYAMKMCWPNGTWFVSKQSKEWTDYSHCGIVDSLRKRLYFHIVTFAVSITALVPALVIFFSYKQLQVHRITMHKNLFLSLLLNGMFVIIFRTMVMTEESDERGDGQNFFQQNGSGCKVLFVITKYLRMTSYMWMFCEGFYLHKLIVAAFAEQKSLVSFYVIGWGFPIIPVGIYAILRKTLKDERCWVIPMETYEWVMHGPYLVSLALNLAFLCNIIRGLVTKIRATHPNEPNQYRKAVRATLVLVPLFGVHFFLDKYRPSPGGCGWMDVYIYFNFAIDGLQGFVVALIFCYLNGEVISLLKRSYQRYKLRHNIQASFSSSLMGGRLSTSTHTSSLNDSASLGSRYPLRHFTRDKNNLREEGRTTGLK